MRTEEGVDIVATGTRDLEPAQRALLQEGEIEARLAGEHAEVTALAKAAEEGLTPKILVSKWEICPACASVIMSSAIGGVTGTIFKTVAVFF